MREITAECGRFVDVADSVATVVVCSGESGVCGICDFCIVVSRGAFVSSSGVCCFLTGFGRNSSVLCLFSLPADEPCVVAVDEIGMAGVVCSGESGVFATKIALNSFSWRSMARVVCWESPKAWW